MDGSHIAKAGEAPFLEHPDGCVPGKCPLERRVVRLLQTPPAFGGLQHGWWLIRQDPERLGLVHLTYESAA